MPILPSSAYVSVESVTQLIRAIANDMIYSQAGEILTDSANVMFPLLNDALEFFQNEVNNHGVDTFKKETVLANVTAIAVTDPGVQVNVSDTGYFDGVTGHQQPQIPTDLLVPTFLWERQNGSTENWIEMNERPDGLPSTMQSSRLRMWEWRQDAIYMPGATQANDLRLRYTGTHASLVTVNDALLFRGATGAIAYKMVSVYLASKNPQAAAIAETEAKARVAQIATRSSRMKQREAVSRMSYGNPMGGRIWIPPRNT